jgi:tRNA pseudouridine-54 N-methylase
MTEKEKKVLRFIQLLPNIPPSIIFTDKDLPGSGRRIDILCRVLAACFDWSPSKRSKTRHEVIAIFANELTLRFYSPEKHLPVGEVAWAEEIRKALQGKPSEFINVEHVGLGEILKRLLAQQDSRVVALIESGHPITTAFLENTKAQNSFMLGDHRGFDSESLRIIKNENIQQISLGTRSYLSSHCVAALISKFERLGN